MAHKPDDDTTLLALLEKGVRDVLGGKPSTAQKLKAIEVGAKVLMIKRKISGDDDGGGSFFPGG